MSLNSINAALGLGLDLSGVTTLPDHTQDEMEMLTLIALAKGTSNSGGGAWGTITGFLSAQADLVAALALKAPIDAPTFTGIVTVGSQILAPGNLSINPGGVLLFPKDILSAAGKYHNWGTTAGALGYGIRDNAGVLQVKSDGGSWVNIDSSELKPSYDVRNYGVLRTNSAATNKTNLQALIDAHENTGAILDFVEPVPMNGGLRLKSGVTLRGNNLAAFNGSTPYTGVLDTTPGGATFIITDTVDVFIKVRANTCITGFVFWYPNQDITTATPNSTLIVYPITIAQDETTYVQGISLTRLCFIGAWDCINLEDPSSSADFEIDLCYGYPMSGKFISISNVHDIPRITRCHVSPGAGWASMTYGPFGAPTSGQVMDYVVANGGPCFSIIGVDEFMMSQCFVFATKTAYRIDGSYGSLHQCQCDIVETGVHVSLNAEYREVSIVGMNSVIGAGLTAANRNAVLCDGSSGTLNLINLTAAAGSSVILPSSISPTGANAMLMVTGSGTKRINLINPRTTRIGAGVWSKFIDNAADAVLVYPSSEQEFVTTVSPFSNLGPLRAETLELTSQLVEVGTAVADRLIRIMIGADEYQIAATLYVPPPPEPTGFEDSFTGSNGTALSAHTADVGGLWTASTNATIQSNRAKMGTGGGSAFKMLSIPDGTIDVIFNAPLAADLGVRFRWNGTTGWFWQINNVSSGSAVAYLIRPDGSIAASGSLGAPQDTDLTLTVILSGQAITTKLNGATIFIASSTINQAAGGYGIYGTENVKFDDLTIG